MENPLAPILSGGVVSQVSSVKWTVCKILLWKMGGGKQRKPKDLNELQK
jgi:hypothetical protein